MQYPQNGPTVRVGDLVRGNCPDLALGPAQNQVVGTVASIVEDPDSGPHLMVATTQTLITHSNGGTSVHAANLGMVMVPLTSAACMFSNNPTPSIG